MVFSQIFHADDHHPARIRNVDKDYARELGFKNIKLLVKIKDIRKIQKKNWPSINAFGYENWGKYPVYISKKLINCCR